MTREDVEEPLARLADVVRKRRKELGLTQRQMAEKSGMGLTTVQNLERGAASPPSRATRDRVEAVLRWEQNSVSAVLRGEEPIPLESGIAEARAAAEAAAARATVLRSRLLDALHRPGAYSGDEIARLQAAAERAEDESAAAYYALRAGERAGRKLPIIETFSDRELVAELERRLSQRHQPAFEDEPAVGADEYDLAAHTDPTGYVRDYDREVPSDEGA